MDSGLLKEDSTQNVNEMRKIIDAGDKKVISTAWFLLMAKISGGTGYNQPWIN